MSLKRRINRLVWFGGPSRDPAENFAARFLKRNGYKIIYRNFETAFAEIDIIAWKADILAFVEVKQRKSTAFGLPREAVGFEKQRKIRRAAEYYLMKNKTEKIVRFDVIEIYGDCNGDKKPRIEHIKNAF